MATRLMTRLSAGAALVTGLGMMGVATALPAHAETTVTYTCTVSVGDATFGEGPATVTFDTDAPSSVGPGDTLTVNSVTADVTIPVNDMTPDTNLQGSGMTFPVNAEVRTGDKVIGAVDATLTSTSITANEGEVRAHLADTQSRSIVVPVEAAGLTFEVLAPTSLEGVLRLPETSEVREATVNCTTEETNRVIDTVVVTSPEMDEKPDDAEDTAVVHDPVDQGQSPAGDAPAEPPAVPQVVQTDGLTPQMMPQDDDTAAFALGGLLLAGAGAGTVLVARRRGSQV